VDHALVARWRLANQLVSRRDATDAAGVVGRLTAVQAQDLLPSAWSLSQRAGGLTRQEVADELDDGRVLRTHVLRPTWHAVAPADIRWLLRATAPRIQRSNATLYQRAGLDDEVRATSRSALATALADGTHRTRDELGTVLERAGVAVDRFGLGMAIMDAELTGVVVSGAVRGTQQTYALLDERAPGDDGRTREEALAELARRFVVTRGPVTEDDLAAWASLTRTEARRAIASIAGELESVQDNGLTWWHGPGEPPAPDGRPRVDLVQAYDELVMSYLRTRDVLTAGVPLFTGSGGAPLHWVLVDGRAAGRWGYRRDAKGRPAHLVVRPFRDWTPAERAALHEAVAAFGRFAGTDVAWTHDPA
jgi:hypothetical protein